MSVVYVLAHFDDEYCALPLIWEAARQGLPQRFIYLADYRNSGLGARRHRETLTFLARTGSPNLTVEPLGLGTGWFERRLHRSTEEVFKRLAETVGAGRGVTRLVAPAWEGGHMDHDACAFLAMRLGERLGIGEIRQFSLYHVLGRPGLLLRAGAPLAAGGSRHEIPLRPAEWLDWMGGVRAFSSQAYAWSGIWPAMFAGLALRGFAWQGLTADRVAERPHPGPLFYERMFHTSYQEVRTALDRLDTPGARLPG